MTPIFCIRHFWHLKLRCERTSLVFIQFRQFQKRKTTLVDPKTVTIILSKFYFATIGRRREENLNDIDLWWHFTNPVLKIAAQGLISIMFTIEMTDARMTIYIVYQIHNWQIEHVWIYTFLIFVDFEFWFYIFFNFVCKLWNYRCICRERKWLIWPDFCVQIMIVVKSIVNLW